ncbi:MAG: DUF4835 family protein [Bacteroidales bacterium]|nr:DUF4835 family protein [Bacteroidales bacterium]MBN2761726.1 DUF4835 family protein [Bacteroidales bacterium]
MKKIIVFTFGLFFCVSSFSQELRCNIQLVTTKIPGTNKQVFQTLQGAITEFMNNTAWTNYKFGNNERIECNMLFNLTDMKGNDQYLGTLQIQARRPVYNSSYNTVIFNYVDNDLDFRYTEYQPLEFSETSHLSGLTSILAYYAYIIMGINFDSFGLQSGTELFQRAEKIVNNAQNAAEKGWRGAESQSRRNRYWLINNILNTDFEPIREFIYIYHRSGLDQMYDKTFEARENILESLTLLQDVYRNRPDPFMHFLQVVLDAKSDEFVNVFSEATDEEKRRALLILNQIDPTHKEKYSQISNPG